MSVCDGFQHTAASRPSPPQLGRLPAASRPLWAGPSRAGPSTQVDRRPGTKQHLAPGLDKLVLNLELDGRGKNSGSTGTRVRRLTDRRD